MPDSQEDDGECPNCGGEGLVWGCFEDSCSCTDDDGLGCSPVRCDWCQPPHPTASGVTGREE